MKRGLDVSSTGWGRVEDVDIERESHHTPYSKSGGRKYHKDSACDIGLLELGHQKR